MIMLLAMPVLLVVGRAYRYLQVYAPSNVLIRQVQTSLLRLRNCAILVVLAAVLLVAMKVVASAVAAGAPGWLNLVVLVLAWDAIKIGGLAVLQFSRWSVALGTQGSDHPHRSTLLFRAVATRGRLPQVVS